MRLNRSLMLFPLLLLAAVVVVSDVAVAQEAPRKAKIEAEESWQVIEMLGQRIGYGHTVVKPIEEDGQTVIRTDSDVHIAMKRFGQKLVMKVSIGTRETVAGDVLSFEYVTQNPPAAPSRVEGKIEGSKLTLTTTVDGKATVKTRDWNKEWKSPTYQDRILRENPLKSGESRSFDVFLPEFAKSAKMTLKGGATETVKLIGDAESELQKVTALNSLLPGIPMQLWLDATGRSQKTSTSLLGTEMVTFTVPEAEALKELGEEELDVAVGTLVKSPEIPNAYTVAEIVFKLDLPSAEAVELLPNSLNQTKKAVSEAAVELTVRHEQLPATAEIQPTDAEFTAPNKFLQSDDPEVVKHATAAVGDAKDPAEQCRLMERYVSETLKNKNFSTAMASAGEVARRLEGDCTEHAVLLAAMLRAKGIPARVAVGLVYVGNKNPSFGGHMWTEAFLDGKWHALDGTLGRGGTTAVHLKFADSSLAEEGLSQTTLFVPLVTILGKMEVEVLSVKE